MSDVQAMKRRLFLSAICPAKRTELTKGMTSARPTAPRASAALA